jgi:D-hydroxyproline dehydrogenase subunit alpha
MPRERRFDVLVVGAGPAGLAAAWAAAQAGKTVGLVDDNPAKGGQIWRGEGPNSQAPGARAWLGSVSAAGVSFLPGTRVFAQPAPGQLSAETHDELLLLTYDQLVLAPGARELFLPFPGWTLPQVVGAGGLQALVKSGMDIKGKRVVVAGSGPLLLAVAAYLRKRGATIAAIAEQAPMSRLVRFGLGLLREPAKLAQALGLKLKLQGIPYRTSCWPSLVNEKGILLTNDLTFWMEPCDFVACGFGLVPNTELPQLLGCALRDGFVAVDALQQTTVAGIFCAGEATGIGGLERSLIEGQIAGWAAAGRIEDAERFFPARKRAHRFARALNRAFRLRDELKRLPDEATIVCRCEDVKYSQLIRYDGWRAAKLETRCGMGPCQGRVCGPALAYLRGWEAESVRPPLFPVRMESLGGG